MLKAEREMLSVDSLQVVEEEVVESSSCRMGDIYTFIAEGCYPQTMNPIRKKNLKRYAQKFVIDDGRLYYVGRKKEEKREVVMEMERKRQIFLECHFNEIGHHLGQKKTVHRIQSKYYWLGIIKDVIDWIKVCETCQHTERIKNMVRTIRPMKVDGPWEVVCVEVSDPFPSTVSGNTYVVIITDYFSKWVEAFPIQKKDPLSVARCISKSIYRFGTVKSIFCLQGADFCEEVTRHLCDRWNVVQKVSPMEQPMKNGLYDHSSELLKDAVKQVVAERQTEWDDFLDPVLSLFRTSTNPTTKFTPFCLMFNRKARVPSEVKADLLSYGQDQEAFAVHEEEVSTLMSVMQEQMSSVKQMVIANMNATYRQQKRMTKRRSRNSPSMALKGSEPLFGTEDTPSPKKLRDNNLYLTFPVEAVFTSEPSTHSDRKNDLEFPLPGPNVH